MLRAVIIEDSAVIRQMIKHIFRQLKIEVIGEAADGISGLELALLLKPDIVTVDIHLPRLDGDEIIRWIKKSRLSTAICVISSVDPEEEERLLTVGADGIINKPVSLEKIVEFCKKAGMDVV